MLEGCYLVPAGDEGPKAEDELSRAFSARKQDDYLLYRDHQG